VPTGLNSLDTQISGGLSPGEFGVISAQTSGCKSTMLLNFAWGAVMDGKKVLVITLEDSQDTVLMRFDSLFSHQEFILFRRDPKRSATLKKKVAKHKDLLYVKDYSSGVCTPAKIRGLLSSMDGIDLVVVDYLDELGGGGKRKDRWQEVEDGARQLKAMAHELKIPLWTATQTSASSYGKEFAGLQDIYGGKGKAHIAHIVLTIVQTDDERKADRLRILVSKQKAGPKGGIIDCRVDLSKCRIYDAKLSPV
jgi:replicative DNA helicase